MTGGLGSLVWLEGGLQGNKVRQEGAAGRGVRNLILKDWDATLKCLWALRMERCPGRQGWIRFAEGRQGCLVVPNQLGSPAAALEPRGWGS